MAKVLFNVRQCVNFAKWNTIQSRLVDRLVGKILSSIHQRSSTRFRVEKTLCPDRSVLVEANNIGRQTQDERFASVIENIKSHTGREKFGMTYITGAFLISEAVRTGAVLKEVYYHDPCHLQAISFEALKTAGVQFFLVSKVLFNKHCNAKQSTDGLLAVIALPFIQTCESRSQNSLPVTMICDNVRDPGNMGMLIQSAVAASCRSILTTKGCVDVWEPKVLQTGRGAHFHASIKSGLNWNEISEILPSASTLYLADSTCCQATVSENVKHETLTSSSQIAVQDYDCIDYGNGHTTVVIGGETESVSEQAYDLCRSRRHLGHRIHIPMMSSVNSLNSAVAGSIILFEIARQLKQSSYK